VGKLFIISFNQVVGKKDTELFLSVHLTLRVSENASLPRQNTIAMSRFRMNFAGYAKNMALIPEPRRRAGNDVTE